MVFQHFGWSQWSDRPTWMLSRQEKGLNERFPPCEIFPAFGWRGSGMLAGGQRRERRRAAAVRGRGFLVIAPLTTLRTVTASLPIIFFILIFPLFFFNVLRTKHFGEEDKDLNFKHVGERSMGFFFTFLLMYTRAGHRPLDRLFFV